MYIQYVLKKKVAGKDLLPVGASRQRSEFHEYN